MFDTHAIARTLTEANFTPDQADALTDAIRQAAEQGDHVTSDQFKAGVSEVRTEIANLDTRLSTQISDLRSDQRTEIAEVRTEIANLDTRLSTQIAKLHAEQQAGIANLEPRLVRWMVGTVFATAGVIFAILRFLAE
jgi:predicted component of type VI protein secretion system